MHFTFGHVRRRVEMAVALGIAALYVLAMARTLEGRGSSLLLGAVFLPLAVGPLAILRRAPLPRPQSLALGFCSVLAGGLSMALLISGAPIVGLALPVIAIAAILCARYPAAGLTAMFLSAGAFGSIAAFTPASGQQLADLAMAALWLSGIWGWTISGRRRPAWLWPGVALLGLYVVLTAGEIFTATSMTAGIQSFRASAWYMSAVLLIAYAPWSESARARLLRAVMVVIALVGAYATLRWVIGPAAQERQQAEKIANNFLDNELRPVGSFTANKELAAWMAMTIPFAAGIALAARGRLRLIAIAGLAVSVVGMLAADVRAGPAAAVPGVVVVIVLFQISQAFRGRRGPAVAIAIAATVFGGAGAFALTLGGKSDTGRRYQAILNPTTDASYQGRLVKWRTALRDIDRRPFGHGLGTTGRVEKRYGRFTDIGSIDVDNSYLKVAYEQGFLVMGLLAIAMLLLLLGLGRRAIVGLNPARAGPAIAAAGTLTAMIVIYFIGDYVEGLPSLGGWILVGIGASQYSGAFAGGGAAAQASDV